MSYRVLPAWAPTDLTGLTSGEIRMRLARIERELLNCAKDKKHTAAAAKRHAAVSEYLGRISPLASECRIELAKRGIRS